MINILSDWKISGYSGSWNIQRVVFSLKLHVTPARSFRMCDLLVQTPWQDRRWRKFWEHLVQAHKDCWCIICHWPLRIYITHGYKDYKGHFFWFDQPGVWETSHHPKHIATTMLPPSLTRRDVGRVLGERGTTMKNIVDSAAWLSPKTVGNCLEIRLES